MRNKTRLFVILGTVLIVVVVSGIYVNYKMDQVVRSLNQPGVLFTDPDNNSSISPDKSDTGDNKDVKSPDSLSPEQPSNNEGKPGSPGKTSPSKVEEDDIVAGVQQVVGKPIDKKDLLKAGLIIIRQLSWEEIEYMYDVGSKGSISAAEMKEVRRILRSRLTDEEIEVMQELGRKYGKNLDFLSAR